MFHLYYWTYISNSNVKSKRPVEEFYNDYNIFKENVFKVINDSNLDFDHASIIIDENIFSSELVLDKKVFESFGVFYSELNYDNENNIIGKLTTAEYFNTFSDLKLKRSEILNNNELEYEFSIKLLDTDDL